MVSWASNALFYHVYPLGLCGAPPHNDLAAPPEPRLDVLHDWVPHLRELGITALYLGPLFESSEHGYDTADYYHVDRRLGTNDTLAALVAALHDNGLRVILDGVFHHVGRDFWAFRDLQTHREQSAYRDWFVGVDFGRQSLYGDPFAYDGWNGHYNLVKLNLHHSAVREHLFGAVQMWIDEFAIDGLRLDVAEVIDPGFLRDLAAFCRSQRQDFWLLGEQIHGDYRRMTDAAVLDSATNYELYKGLYSSHNDGNYFELAHSLDRQFGAQAMYRDLPLYNFVDNHDVNRIASTLRNPAHLYPLHALLLTIPGVPSIYYGSEWGIAGIKHGGDDAPLRPSLSLAEATLHVPHPNLAATIARFARVRQQSPALQRGSYHQLFVAQAQFAFARRHKEELVIVAVNAADTAATFDLAVDAPDGTVFCDMLEPDRQCIVQRGRVQIDAVPPCWASVLARQ